ncbi:MAG: AMP-dependent synthetase/ligase [Dongiaceae bacterium]
MSYVSADNLPALLFKQAARQGGRPFLWRKSDGAWRATSYGEAARQVNLLARCLVGLGVEPGDRIALVSENRPEWLIADHAIMAAGAFTVPPYVTNTTADHAYILTHSGAKGVIVSTAALAQRLLPAAIESPDIKFVISIENPATAQRTVFRQLSWEDALRDGAARPDDIAARIGRQKRSDVCCLIYTSGTGGRPKGVMLSHGAILHNCRGAHEVLQQIGLDDEVFLSFLPLSHSYEHTAGQFFPVSLGAQIYYAESVDKLTDNMAEARPTLILAVPRLYEVMHQRIVRAMEKMPPFRRRMFEMALRLGRKRHENPRGLSFGEKVLDRLCDVLVRRKAAQRFGGRLKAFVSGGAPLNEEIGLFFTALGVRILQGYGQTESAPVASVNPPVKVKLHTVGPPLRDTEFKIADDGEILIRGELTMSGYWRDSESTAMVLRGGWLHTGDIGRLDADGYLQITDRKKDIIVLSGGDNVAPARIEGFLLLEPEIAQAMVIGDKRPHLVALLIPEMEFARRWARENKVAGEIADWVALEPFRKAMAAAVERVNKSLSNLEKIRRFTLAAEPFTIENEMLTPSMKIRRHKIRERHGAALDALYERART